MSGALLGPPQTMRLAPRDCGAWRRHGVLMIVPARSFRQQPLAIAEHHAIARCSERAPLPGWSHTFPGPRAAVPAARPPPGRSVGPRRRRCRPAAPRRPARPASARCVTSIPPWRRPRHGPGYAGRAAAARRPASAHRTSRSCPRCVLGNAITSRIDSAPVMSATMRSRPNAMPPCGGAPYCSASSRKPNFRRWSSGADLQRGEHLCLHVRAVDAHRAAADLPAVQDDVVGLGERAAGIVREELLVAVLGRGERVVARAPGARARRRTRTSESRPPTAASILLPRARGRGRPSCAARRGASLTTFALSAPKKIRSPIAAPVRARIVAQHARATGT